MSAEPRSLLVRASLLVAPALLGRGSPALLFAFLLPLLLRLLRGCQRENRRVRGRSSHGKLVGADVRGGALRARLPLKVKWPEVDAIHKTGDPEVDRPGRGRQLVKVAG